MNRVVPELLANKWLCCLQQMGSGCLCTFKGFDSLMLLAAEEVVMLFHGRRMNEGPPSLPFGTFL